MELLIISSYTAVCIAVFTVLRLPLNKWTVPTASIGGVVMVFVLVQLLNFYHPHTDMSRQYLSTAPVPGLSAEVAEAPLVVAEPALVAWFQQNELLRLNDGNATEVTFDSIPGEVFSGEISRVLPTLGDESRVQDSVFDPAAAESQSRIPVLISITDPAYVKYMSRLPDGSRAQAAIYGEQLQELALVRKTLLRMSAWMNYLSLLS